MAYIEEETEKSAKQAIFSMITLHYWYFLSVPGSFAVRENEISLEKLDWKT